MDPVLLLNLVATLAMTGLIWMVQLVHYPLLARVGRDEFPGYHEAHASRISVIVGPLIALEAVTALLLAVAPREELPALPAAVGLALVIVNLASTAFVQVPLHQSLADEFEGRAHHLLVRTNWIRTAAWSLRAVLLSVALA